MRAWMRISVLVILFILASNHASFAQDISPEINTSFAPGADGSSVTLSGSVAIPTTNHQNSPTNESGYKVGPLVWSWSYVPVSSQSALENGCDPSIQAPSHYGAVFGQKSDTGILINGIYRDRITSEIKYQSYFCRETGDDPIPDFAPDVPTYFEIWNGIYSKAFTESASSSGAYVAPFSPGLTGLPTHIWAEFPDGQTISREVSLPGGFRVQASAEITRVSIFLASPDSPTTNLAQLTPDLNSRIDGGSFEHPRVVHVFNSKGEYIISTGIIWSAQNAILSGPGIDPINVPLGSIRIEINRKYQVEQLVPGLVR